MNENMNSENSNMAFDWMKEAYEYWLDSGQRSILFMDILLVPDLVSGNILGKDLEYLAAAQMAGLVVGTKVPIILTSRSDPPKARLISCAVAALVSHRKE